MGRETVRFSCRGEKTCAGPFFFQSLCLELCTLVFREETLCDLLLSAGFCLAEVPNSCVGSMFLEGDKQFSRAKMLCIS